MQYCEDCEHYEETDQPKYALCRNSVSDDSKRQARVSHTYKTYATYCTSVRSEDTCGNFKPK